MSIISASALLRLAHLRAGDEPLAAAIVEREHSTAAVNDVNDKAGMFPGFELSAADIEWRATDFAH